MDDHRAGGLRSFDCEELPRHNRPLADFNERIIRGARLSRGLSAKQIEILQVLASHWHGEGTVTHLASIYAVRPEDLCERPHQVLKRTKRALASLELRGLVTTNARDDTAGHPRWSEIGRSGACTREGTLARITATGRVVAARPSAPTPEKRKRGGAVEEPLTDVLVGK
jgi:hypothetical protein